jgi:hypothetical protein
MNLEGGLIIASVALLIGVALPIAVNFGPQGTWAGGREKAPTALCRKVALAKVTHSEKACAWPARCARPQL